MKIPDDIRSSLPDIAKKVALPAVLAGAGTGALSGYMSARNHPAGETPSQRRRRIVRNALVGTLLGGTAGAALPLGVKTLTEPFVGKPEGFAPLQRAMGFGAAHAAPLAAGVGGAMYLNKLRSAEKAKALATIFGRLKGTNIGQAGTKITDPGHLSALLEGGGRDSILKALAAQGDTAGPTVERILKSHELLGEAGYGGKVLAGLGSGKDIWGTLKPFDKLTAPSALKEYLLSQSSLPGKLQNFGISGLMSKAVGGEVMGRSTTPIAEAYLNHIRPGASRMMGRSGWMGRLGLLGGGVLAAKELQDALVGQQ